MVSQDRTAEFFSLVQSLPSNLSSSSSSSTSNTPIRSNHDSNNNIHNDSKLNTGRYQNEKQNVKRPEPNEELRSFHKTASIISKEIYSTSTLLSQLTSLIHSRSASLFVDDSNQVNDLVLRIKYNIESLNTKLDAAQGVIQRNKRKLGKHSQAGMEASNLVDTLKEEFMNTTQGFKNVLQERTDKMKLRNDREHLFLGGGGGDSSNSTALDDANRSEDRVSLLGNKPKVYSSSSTKDHDTIQTSLTSFGSTSVGVGAGVTSSSNDTQMEGPRLDLTSAIMSFQSESNSVHDNQGSGLPRPYGIKHNDNYENSKYDANAPLSGMRLRHSASSPLDMKGLQSNPSINQAPTSLPVYTPLDLQMMEEASGQSEMMQLIPNQTYLRERADAMSAVESNIAELGTIFNKLAVMVNEHSEMVQRVEDNVDAANDNITLSMNTLMDTLDNLRSNRQLFFRVMAVLVIFIITFITLFA